MEKKFTITEILNVINYARGSEDLRNYTKNDIMKDIESEQEINEKNNIEFSLIECIGIFAYQSHFVRYIATEKILQETHLSVSDFCKENEIKMEFGEIIAISKLCQKISDKEKKIVKSKINKNNKEVKMFDVSILKKVMKLN